MPYEVGVLVTRDPGAQLATFKRGAGPPGGGRSVTTEALHRIDRALVAKTAEEVRDFGSGPATSFR